MPIKNDKEYIMNPGIFLFFWKGQFLYIGKGIDTKIHDHHSIQIAISFDNSIEIKLQNSTFKSKAFIIDSDVHHECRTKQSTFALLNIAPESKIGIALKRKYFTNQNIFILPEDITFGFITNLKIDLNSENKNHAFYTTQNLLNTLIKIEEISILDERIVKTLNSINVQIDTYPTIKELAINVFISPSRLIHLFSYQVGIPIRKYILWRKLLVAIKALVKSRNITRAALEGGFSDAPHFNKTFKKMFGVSPSVLLKNSQIIQVYNL